MNAPAKKRVSGPTQAEGDRKRKQVLIRLSPAELRDLDRVAKAWGVSRSDAVARLVEERSGASRVTEKG